MKISEAPTAIKTAVSEQREELREKREILGEELKEVHEEHKLKREELAEEFLTKINGFQQSKLKNIKKFVSEIPEDLEAYEKLRDKVSVFKNIKY